MYKFPNVDLNWLFIPSPADMKEPSAQQLTTPDSLYMVGWTQDQTLHCNYLIHITIKQTSFHVLIPLIISSITFQHERDVSTAKPDFHSGPDTGSKTDSNTGITESILKQTITAVFEP